MSPELAPSLPILKALCGCLGSALHGDVEMTRLTLMEPQTLEIMPRTMYSGLPFGKAPCSRVRRVTEGAGGQL
jgi:hypothetical protein